MNRLLLFAAVLSISFFSCKKKDPGPKRKMNPETTINQTNAVPTTDTVVVSANY